MYLCGCLRIQSYPLSPGHAALFPLKIASVFHVGPGGAREAIEHKDLGWAGLTGFASRF